MRILFGAPTPLSVTGEKEGEIRQQIGWVLLSLPFLIYALTGLYQATLAALTIAGGWALILMGMYRL